MTAQDLIRQVRSHGGQIEGDGKHLHLTAPEPLPAALVDQLRAHKPEILGLLCGESRSPSLGLPMDMGQWPEEARDWYEERTAIFQFDAAVPRNLAEQKAEAMTREHFGRGWMLS